jgi:uncharacterized damage-inducible protein DinB
MTGKDVIKQALEFSRMVTLSYIEDMSDADLLVRPVPTANHTAWQLGHLIASEHGMVTALGHDLPPLPAGFPEQHTKETARSDDPATFLGKAAYLDLMTKTRTATLAAIDQTPENDLDKAAPEQLRDYAPTVAAVLAVLAAHELMHAGQCVTVRRKLGKPILF